MADKRILSISVGNYLIESGGVNKVIFEHQDYYKKNDVDYLYVYPLSLKKFGIRNYTNKWVCIHDGQFDVVDVDGIVRIISEDRISAIHIHHYNTDRMSEIERICDAGPLPIFFFIHDYWTICPKYTNFVECEMKDLLSFSSCSTCKYSSLYVADVLQEHFIKIKDRFTVIAPSSVALEKWNNRYGALKVRSLIVPHDEWLYKKANRTNEGKRKIRIAFVGNQTDYKGWRYFQELLSHKELECLYEFYHFGAGTFESDNLKRVKVNFHKGRSAMTDALREEHIDIAILISTIAETYSFTYYECFAADAFVITCAESGNIESQVKKNKNGIVLHNPDELISAIKDYEGMRRHLCEYWSDSYHEIPYDSSPNKELLNCAGNTSKKNECTENVIKQDLILSLIHKLYMGLSIRKRSKH